MTLKMLGSILGIVIATATIGGLVDAWVEHKIGVKVGPVAADVKKLEERIDGVIRAQEWQTYRALLAERAQLKRKADSDKGLSPAERVELDNIETELELLKQRLKDRR